MLDSLIFLQIVKKVCYEIIRDWFEGISVLVQILLWKHIEHQYINLESCYNLINEQ